METRLDEILSLITPLSVDHPQRPSDKMRREMGVTDHADTFYDTPLTLRLRVGEEELLLMAAALVDADCFEGAVLYTTKYIEASIQKKSEVTYLPREELLELMKNSPNIAVFTQDYEIGTLREELEKRLQEVQE